MRRRLHTLSPNLDESYTLETKMGLHTARTFYTHKKVKCHDKDAEEDEEEECGYDDDDDDGDVMCNALMMLLAATVVTNWAKMIC